MRNRFANVKVFRRMLEIKITVTEMKSTFNGLIYRLDTTEKINVEFEDLSVEI